MLEKALRGHINLAAAFYERRIRMEKRAGKYRLIASIVSAMLILSADVYAISPEKVIPMGETVGIDFQIKGIIIEDMTEYTDENGNKYSPAKDAGLKAGDVILFVNGAEMTCAEDIKREIDRCGGDDVTVTVRRGETERQYTVKPRKNDSGGYELGLWLRDGMSGLGTLTFYDGESGIYGALGHPVSESGDKGIVEVKNGKLYSAEITGISKGKAGKPGQIRGSMDTKADIGTVDENTMYGIYGKLDGDYITDGREYIEVADEKDIKIGKAQIMSSVSGETRLYDAEVTRVYGKAVSDGKTMMLTVTDKELLRLTGGIVQGMSGSPIIQNGKLIGAVTHVLVGDPTRGYGIGIKTMLEAAG